MGPPTHADIIEFSTSCCNLKVWEQNCVWLFYFYFERNYVVLKSKSPCLLLNKNINFTLLERLTLWFSSCRNRELKVKLWWVRARERKKKAFFVTFNLSEGNFFNIGVLSQIIVYWINFQNTSTFTYQKTLLHIHFCCLFLKSSKAFRISWSMTASQF